MSRPSPADHVAARANGTAAAARAPSPGQADGPVEAARALGPLLRAAAEDAERDSRLPASTVHALLGAGLFRLGVPRRFGGTEAGMVTVLDVTSELARACPASAWVVAISYGAQHVAANMGGVVRRELWGGGPDVPLCSTFDTGGLRATATGGGYVVSGRCPWASGCRHAPWAVLAVTVVDDRGTPGGEAVVAVPTARLRIEDTWDMAGMRGTGSATLIADRVFVPGEHVRPFPELPADAGDPVEPAYRIPLGSMATLSLTGTLLGTAQAILDHTMAAVASDKPLAGSTYRRLADSPGVQANLADAVNLIDSARLHLHRSARHVDGSEPGRLDLAARARVRMDVGYASRILREAAALLLDVSGASSFARSNPVQRHWRDLETACRHPALNTELSREIYGRALVGASEQVTDVV